MQLLGLMSQMLWDSAADQHFMLRRHGFAIFVFLLRQLPPIIWTVQAVTACVQLTSCFASSEALHHEAVWLLFGAPRLWIFTQLEVQLEVYEVLHEFIVRKPRAFLQPSATSGEPLLSLQRLLDDLEVYYWRQPSATSFARQPLRHAVSGEVIGERPSIEGLKRLRRKVLNLLQVLAEAELTRADAKCLVTVLRSCRDAWVLIDVVKLLINWLSPLSEASPSALSPCGMALVARLTELAQLGEETMYDTLVDLLHGDAELLRLAALRLLGLLLGASAGLFPPPAAIWSRVTFALGGTALSKTTYSALMDTLVGKASSVTLDPTTLFSDQTVPTRVVFPQLLGTVLQLLPTAAFSLQRQALLHLTQLCCAHPANCDAMLDVPAWQRWLLQLLVPSSRAHGSASREGTADGGGSVPGSGGSGSGGSGGTFRQPSAVTLRDDPNTQPSKAGDQLLPMLQHLLQVVHSHALLHREAGWRTLQQSFGYVRIVLTDAAAAAAATAAAPPAAEPAGVSNTAPHVRSVSRGMLEGAITALMSQLPAHCAKSPALSRYSGSGAAGKPPVWGDNLEQLLTFAKRFIFDENGSGGDGGGGGGGDGSGGGGGGGEPQAAQLESVPDWSWILPLSPRLDVADLPVVIVCLELLHLLGILVSTSAPAQDWAAVRALRAYWTVYCEAQVGREVRLPTRSRKPAGGAAPPPSSFIQGQSGVTGAGAGTQAWSDLAGLAGAIETPVGVGSSSPPPLGLSLTAGSSGEIIGTQNSFSRSRLTVGSSGALTLTPVDGGVEAADLADLEDEPRSELEGGLYWLALVLLLRSLASHQLPQPVWLDNLARLSRLLIFLQPATHVQPHRVQKVTNLTMRRQRLQVLCGQWQAGVLERQCSRLLPGTAAANASCCQGALLFALTWLHAILADTVPAAAGRSPPTTAASAGEVARLNGISLTDSTALAERQRELEQLLMTLMTLFEPYPFARQQRVSAARDLHSSSWRAACTPLLQQVMRAHHQSHHQDADLAMVTNGGVLQRLRASNELQRQREAQELEHGSDVWQNRMVVLHEEETARRDELVRSHGHQERLVARLWLKLQRYLTHQRAPWAAPQSRLKAEAFVRLSRSENALRQRCRLKRIEHGTRHESASKARRSVAEADEAQQGAQGSSLDERAGLLLLPSGVALSKLCEGSDGEEWDETKAKAVEGLEGDPLARALSLTPQDIAQPATEESRRPVQYEFACDLVTPQRIVAGTLELGTTRLTFVPDLAEAERQLREEICKWEVRQRGERPETKPPREKEWQLSSMSEVHRRRYLLRASALELFFRDAPPVFLNLRNKPGRRRLLSKLRYACPSAHVISPTDTKWVKELSARWQSRQISNFDFLMRLNTLAGRTYNDPNQYPVFPWVLQDYSSETLDLDNPATFRDLSKPMGALRPARAEEVKARYEQLKEMQREGVEGQPPPFHYGSHYSSASIMLFYMIRLEPMTTLAIRLQGGFFDHADRLFHSIAATFEAACTNTADVKELIPEFYYLPEFLRNSNGIHLGVRQDGVHLDDVVLPRWANGPHDFVRKHRMALESKHVSAHLHEWVDLVFGYKQRGVEAETSLNVFYYLTYEGAVDLDAIDDPRERAATEAQISNFGNTPSQLLTKAHPPRAPLDPTALATTLATVTSAPTCAVMLHERQLSRAPLLAVALTPERIVGVGADRRTSTVKWQQGVGLLEPPGRVATDVFIGSAANERRPIFGVPFVEGLLEHPATRFAVSADGRHLFSCGYWDRSVRCSNGL